MILTMNAQSLPVHVDGIRNCNVYRKHAKEEIFNLWLPNKLNLRQY